MKHGKEISRWIKATLLKGTAVIAMILLSGTPRLPAQDATPSTSGKGTSVAGLKDCIGPTFDDQGIISIASHCPVPVEAMWFFGSGNQGNASLAPGEKVSTGTAAADIPRLGVLRFLACPSSHPIFHDNDGQYVTTPVETYHCDIDNARVSTSTLPRSFTYDQLTSGDCVLERGALTFNSKGEGQWRARIHTNHTTNRDIWHVSFNVVDSNGRPLFPVSPGDSPAMYGSPSPTIPWAVTFTFDAAKFRLIDHVTIRTNC